MSLRQATRLVKNRPSELALSNMTAIVSKYALQFNICKAKKTLAFQIIFTFYRTEKCYRPLNVFLFVVSTVNA